MGPDDVAKVATVLEFVFEFSLRNKQVLFPFPIFDCDISGPVLNIFLSALLVPLDEYPQICSKNY